MTAVWTLFPNFAKHAAPPSAACALPKNMRIRHAGSCFRRVTMSQMGVLVPGNMNEVCCLNAGH